MDKIVRMNIKVPESIRDWYKSEGDKYSVPYTNYISMLLTQIYEKEIEKSIVTDFTDVMKQMQLMFGQSSADDLKSYMDNIKNLSNQNIK